MRPLPDFVRPWPYLIAGLLVGFLFLGEFAMNTLAAVQAGLLALAIVSVVGVVRGWRYLEFWSLFVTAALLVPLTIDARLISLSRCGDVPPGVACLAGTRDVLPQFLAEVVTFAIAFMGITLLIAREISQIARHPSDN